jgi:hypothetical protein
MVTEAQRFPELAAIVAREGGRAEVVEQIAGMLEREAPAPSASGSRGPRPSSTPGRMIASTCSSTAAASGSHVRLDWKRGNARHIGGEIGAYDTPE